MTDVILLLACLVPALLFTLAYGLLVPWYRSAEGRHLFGFTLVMVLIFGRAVALRLDLPVGGVWAPRLLLAAVAIFLWHRLWLLLRRQWLRREEP